MSQILLGTINTGFGCIFQREKQVSIPLGTINTKDVKEDPNKVNRFNSTRYN